jgi:hypothetical protein
MSRWNQAQLEALARVKDVAYSLSAQVAECTCARACDTCAPTKHCGHVRALAVGLTLALERIISDPAEAIAYLDQAVESNRAWLRDWTQRAIARSRARREAEGVRHES